MKKVVLATGLAISFVLLLFVMAACNSNQGKLKEIAGPPPASLDQYFPPRAPAPVYLLEMFALAGPFEGVAVDLQEQDIAGAKANYQAFKTQYDKVAGMVPEWKDRFPKEPIDALGKALDSGDPAKVGPAMGGVAEACGSCHQIYQVKVQQKYHWPDFDNVKVADPLSGDSVAFGDFMVGVAGAYSGIAVDLQEGQLDNARKNFQAFNARFKALAASCSTCHTSPRTYYVDASVQAMVDQLGKAVAATPPDAQAVQQLSGAIGNESCLKCHLVHLPAQNAKDTWKKFGDLFK